MWVELESGSGRWCVCVGEHMLGSTELCRGARHPEVNCPKCGTGKSASKPGDWCCPNPQCVNHQNTVYGSKMQCTRCGAARPPLNAKGGAMPNESPMMVGDPPAFSLSRLGFGGAGGQVPHKSCVAQQFFWKLRGTHFGF